MTWNRVLKIAECKVGLCEATDCTHNEDRKCTLEYVSINPKGGCAEYEKGESMPWHNLPEGRTRGQQSFIDRATRTLREQKEANE